MKHIRSLSKSKIMAFLQCPRRLWLEVHHPELRDDYPHTLTAFDTGHSVGELARRIYDPKQTATLIDPIEHGFTTAFEKTKALVKSGKPVFEAAFSANGALALADVLLPMKRRGKRKWKMIEVKSSVHVKDYHLDDVAIQAYIARKSGLDLVQVSLAHIDNSWVYPGNEDYRGLLTESDLTEQAFAREKEVSRWIKSARKTAAQKREPGVRTGVHCDSPYSCGFYGHCSENEPCAERPVTWLPHVRSRALRSFIEDNDIIDLSDVPDELLNAKQLLVKKCSISGRRRFNRKQARESLAVYGLPAYFLDFETVHFAIPRWKGTRPCQKVPFQFSLHKLGRNGKLTHTQFLDLSGKDPSRHIARKLIDKCGKMGPVYVYNASFEAGCIRELAARYRNLEQPLLSIQERLVDLLPIARECYYHPDQCGSWSIKSILPTIAPELCYDELDGVQDGGMAMDAYVEATAENTARKRKAEIADQLSRYCEMDTLALVRLWEFFLGKSYR